MHGFIVYRAIFVSVWCLRLRRAPRAERRGAIWGERLQRDPLGSSLRKTGSPEAKPQGGDAVRSGLRRIAPSS